MKVRKNEKGQAVAPQSVMMSSKDLVGDNEVRVYWLGGGGMLLHSEDVNIMIDPVLRGFDMPLLYDVPITANDIDKLDAILITHIDNDHFSRDTCRDLKGKTKKFYAPMYVADVMNEEGFDTHKCDIGDTFDISHVHVQTTKAKHNWQNGSKKWQYRYWEEHDYCGYWMETHGKKIWMPGDSRLLDEHLHMDHPDVIMFDFADNDWHIGLDNAITLANTYPNADLICIHWGSVDACDMTPFNGNPEDLYERVINPERIKVLAPGEAYKL